MNLEQRSAIDTRGSDSPSQSRLGATLAAAQDLRKRNPRYRKPARKTTPVWLQELRAK